MERACLECGDTIRGRSDKKFCSDSCRNAHHNQRNKSHNNLIRTTNNRLRKNHRILLELHKDEPTKVNGNTLQKRGFVFDYLTGIYTTKAGSTYRYVYDMGYLPLENNWYLLVRKEKLG